MKKALDSTSRMPRCSTKAMRDSQRGLLSPHQAASTGAANTRGGLGAEFCAMIGRYSNGMIFYPVPRLPTATPRRPIKAPPPRVNYQSHYGKQFPSWPTVGGNYRKLIERIDEAAAKSGREASAIKLLAAAKSQSIEAIRDRAGRPGLRSSAKNYVQEAGEKKSEISMPVRMAHDRPFAAQQARLAVELFDVIESLDNLALARELDKEGRRRGKIIRAFVEINLGGEGKQERHRQESRGIVAGKRCKAGQLRIEGLMTVPPFLGRILNKCGRIFASCAS